MTLLGDKIVCVTWKSLQEKSASSKCFLWKSPRWLFYKSCIQSIVIISLICQYGNQNIKSKNAPGKISYTFVGVCSVQQSGGEEGNCQPVWPHHPPHLEFQSLYHLAAALRIPPSNRYRHSFIPQTFPSSPQRKGGNLHITLWSLTCRMMLIGISNYAVGAEQMWQWFLFQCDAAQTFCRSSTGSPGLFLSLFR